MNYHIYKVLVGSRAYGTSTPESDYDFKGVYCQDIDDLIGFRYMEQYEKGKEESYYEIRRFIQLIQTANPTVLEMLYAPEECVLVKQPQFDIILKHRDSFLTKKCLLSFGGYAVQQIKNAIGLDKKMNWEKERLERKTVIDFCYFYENGKTIPMVEYLVSEKLHQENCGLVKLEHFRDAYAVYYDYQHQYGACANRSVTPMGYNGVQNEKGNALVLSEVPRYAQPIGIMYWNKDAFTIHCRDYQQYQTWVKERNENRYVETEKHKQRIDGKNLMHCRRMIDMAKEIATEGTIRVKRPNAEYLLSIRRGDVDLNKLISDAETDIKELDGLFTNSEIPEKVSNELCEEILLEIRHYDS